MDFKELFQKVGFAILYLAVAFVGLAIVVGVLLYFFKREKLADFKKYFIGIAAGISLCALTVLTYLKVEHGIDKESYGLVFYPVLVEIIIAVVGLFAIFICSLFNRKAVKIAGITTSVLLLGGFIAMMVEMTKYFEIVGYEGYNFNLAGLAVSAVVFMAVIAIIYFLGDKRNISDTRSIVYGAIAIAMSFALSYIKLYEMPQGGSITLASLLPLMIYCCMFGTRRGTIACLIYGVLQAVQDPWILHPMQFLLDYPLAFGMIGVSGIFVEKGIFKGKLQVVGFALGAIIAVIGRFICHVLSGVFAFAALGSTFGGALAYSLGYNSFAFVDLTIALGVGVLLFLSKAFTTQMAKSGDVGKTSAPTEAVEIEEEDDGFVYLDDLKAQAQASEQITEQTHEVIPEQIQTPEETAEQITEE